MDYVSATIEELEAELTRLHGLEAELAGRRREVSAVMNAKLAERRATESRQQLIESGLLTQAELEALEKMRVEARVIGAVARADVGGLPGGDA